MNTEPLRIERRHTQRFSFHLPASIRLAGSDREGFGFTQDLSLRGALFFTDLPLAEGDAVELTLQMPSEITLTEATRVRCTGKVKRVDPPAGGTARGVAVHLEKYEFLPEVANARKSVARVSALHPGAAEPADLHDHLPRTLPLP